MHIHDLTPTPSLLLHLYHPFCPSPALICNQCDVSASFTESNSVPWAVPWIPSFHLGLWKAGEEQDENLAESTSLPFPSFSSPFCLCLCVYGCLWWGSQAPWSQAGWLLFARRESLARWPRPTTVRGSGKAGETIVHLHQVLMKIKCIFCKQKIYRKGLVVAWLTTRKKFSITSNSYAVLYWWHQESKGQGLKPPLHMPAAC